MATVTMRYDETINTIEPELTGGEWYCSNCGTRARTMRDPYGRMHFICISPRCEEKFDGRRGRG